MLMVDNDALIKFGAWDLMDKSLDTLAFTWEQCRRLESLKYMLPSLKADLFSSLSETQFEKVVNAVDRMPVLDEEIDADLANELLEISDIDPGEAAILSGLLSVPVAELLSGDKRALSAFAVAANAFDLQQVKGRCHCVESLLLLLVAKHGFADIGVCLRQAVEIDTAVRMCLGHDGTASELDFCAGLRSYINGFDGAVLLKAIT